MKRIKAACLEQTIQFQLKDGISAELAKQQVLQEYESYKAQIVQSASPRQAAPETPAKPRQSVRVRLERLKEGQAAQTKLPDRARHAPTRPKQK